MQKNRLVFVGGFLGAGKTTLLRYLIRLFLKQGKAIGAIANDQADGLIDTKLLLRETDIIKEVSGSCFCCNYDGLINAVREIISSGKKIDLIFAEPVGSCADISATILQPLKDGLGIDIQMSPYTVLADAVRLDKILNQVHTDLHPDAQYIYKKQLEEADVIALSKADTISDLKRDNLIAKLGILLTNRKIFALSAETGNGVKEWLTYILENKSSGNRIPAIDYEIYGRGEAILGWMNASLTLYGNEIDWDMFLKNYFTHLSESLKKLYINVAHIKIMIETPGERFMIGNIANTLDAIKLRGSAGIGNEAEMTINARVEAAPRLLNKIIFDALMLTACDEVVYQTKQCKYFQPGFPKPVHRYQHVVHI